MKETVPSTYKLGPLYIKAHACFLAGPPLMGSLEVRGYSSHTEEGLQPLGGSSQGILPFP